MEGGGEGGVHKLLFHAFTGDMPIVLAGGLNLDVKPPDATFAVSSLVDQIELVCYADSKMPTTREAQSFIFFR